MGNFKDQLDQIKTLLSSNTNSHKPFAYATLAHLQEQASTEPSLIQSLADSSHTLLSFILIDISVDDEEIAAQALKCLGFTIYHPSIVAAIPGNYANMILNSLEKVVTTTKIKSVCNLGVWCISIQQFNASVLATNFHSLLRATVHALDNPIGSLSTTFEAIQAVMKLTNQLSDKMRDTSNIWAPPIYRRLVSVNKREKDMAERCLLKIRSTICPPPVALSKAVSLDMKKKLLPAMKGLLNQGMKIQMMQAWGWFIRLIGPYALKNRHLVNEMLKIPEQTFSDVDPQVQIATQVAWEGLIDALIQPPIKAPAINTATEHGIQQVRSSKGNDSEIEADGFLKRIKLIMTPLTGIISCKCDVSVHSSCLNTWHYLLHKLDTSVNCPSVIRTVCEPIFEVVFQIGPHSRNIWSWNFCLDMLDNFALARIENVSYDLNNQVSGQLSVKTPMIGLPVSGESSWKHFPIKWLPWDLSLLDFFIKMIHMLISHGSNEAVAPRMKSLACNAAVRIFRSLLKGVKNIHKNSSVSYNEFMLSLTAILTCLKKICEDANSEDSGINDLHQTSLQFIVAVTEELESSLLGSPLYKVSSDLKYIDNLESEFRHAKIMGIHMAYMNRVSPIVFLTLLYFSVVVKSTLYAAEAESILQGIFIYVRSLLSMYDPREILDVIIGLLYKHLVFKHCLNIWIAIANSLKDYIGCVKDLSQLRTGSDNDGYLVVCQLLSYPFAVFSCQQRRMTTVRTSDSLELSPVSESQRKLELEHVIGAWKSLYASVTHASQFECSSNSFSEDLSSMINGCLDENTSMFVSGTELDPWIKHQNLSLFSLCGDVVICVLEWILTLEVSFKGSKSKDDVGCRRFTGVNNSLGLAARFMSLSWTKAATSPPTGLDVTSRVFSTLVRFVGSLHLSEDIISFLETLSSPLLQWLSCAEVQDENTTHELQLLWIEILNCLRTSSPPINFDSSVLELQAPLLERTLDHPNPSISEATITFWNSTYSEQIKLEYPQNLLPVLDKLSRKGEINLCKRSLLTSEKSNSSVADVITAPRRYKVTALLNRGSKRVELVEDTVNGLRLKRKSAELTEHQKEVRRAQQGRARDCEGRGPGIRTYTSVDFSQGNEESQESQETWKADSILEMLTRDGKLS